MSHVAKLKEELKECTFKPKVNNYHPDGPCRFNSGCSHGQKWMTGATASGGYTTSNLDSAGFGDLNAAASRQKIADLPLGYLSNFSGGGLSTGAIKNAQSNNTPASNEAYMDIIQGNDPIGHTTAASDGSK